MQDLTGFNRRIADDLTAAGQPVTPANINHIRAYYGLKPTSFTAPAPAEPEGGGFFDIFKGSAAQGIAQTYDIGRLAEEKLGTDTVGGAILSSVVSPLVPPGLSQPVGRALQSGLSKATGGAVDVGRFASQARSGIKDRFQSVADAPENQPRPGEEDTFKTNLARASGSSVGFAPMAIAGGLVAGPAGSAALVGLQGAGMEGVSGYYDALEQTGGDEEKAWAAFLLKGLGGATEGLDAIVPVAGKLGKFLFALNRGTGGAVNKALAGITAKTLAAGAVKGAAMNSGQEVFQEVWDNKVNEFLDIHPETRMGLLDAIKQFSWTVGAPSAVMGAFFGSLEAKISQSEAKVQREQYLESARVERPDLKPKEQTASAPIEGQPAPEQADTSEPTDPAYQRVKQDMGGEITGEVEVPETLKPLAEFAAKRGFALRAVTTKEGGKFRGATVGKDILLNVNRPDDAIEYTFDHELSHGLKSKMGESWTSLRSSIEQVDPEGLAAWEEAAGGRQVLDEQLQSEEGVAYYVENVMAPYLRAQRKAPQALAKIAQDDRTTFRKMVEGVLDIANEFGAGFNTYKAQIKKVLGDVGTVGKRMPPKKAVAIAQQFSAAWDGLIEVARNEAAAEAERVKTEEAAAQAKAEQRAAEIEQEYADYAATGGAPVQRPAQQGEADISATADAPYERSKAEKAYVSGTLSDLESKDRFQRSEASRRQREYNAIEAGAPDYEAAQQRPISAAAWGEAVLEEFEQFAGRRGLAELQARAAKRPLLLGPGPEVPSVEDQRRSNLERVQELLKRGMSRKAQVVQNKGEAARPETPAEITARVNRVKKMAERLDRRMWREAKVPYPKGPEKITATGVPSRQQAAIPLESKEIRVERVANQQAAAMEAGMPDYELAMQQEAQSKADAPGVEAMRVLGEPRYSLARDASDALDQFKRSAPVWAKAMRAKLIDNFTYTKEILEKATGKPYQQIQAFRQTLARRSKTAYRSSESLETRIRALGKALREKKVKVADLDSFLHARVAPIANKIVEDRRKADPNAPATFSGMTDEAATEIISGFQKDPALYKKLVELARMVDEANDYSLRLALRSQLISQEDFDRMKAAYNPATYGLENPEGFSSWYASMRDIPETHEEYVSQAAGRNIGQGIGPMGKVYKARLGRRVRLDPEGNEITADMASPVANAFMDLQNNIIRSVKAEEQRAYAKLVKDLNDPTFGVVLERIPTTEVLGSDGYVHTIPDPNWMSRPEILPFKENGKWRAIEFAPKAQRVALDLKALTVLKPYESVAAITRWYSGLLTRNNPGFMVKNAFRDFGWAFLVSNIKYGPRFASAMMGEYRGAISELAAAYRGKGDSALLKEYRASGAESSVYALRDYDMTLKEMDRLVKGGNSFDGFKAWWERYIGGANDVIENGMRFAAFRAARKMGKTADEAMIYAKEGIALNFEQTGEYGRRINSLYAFFSAGVNGADALWRLLSHKDATIRQRALAAMSMMVAVGVVNETLNRMLGFEDEDGVPLIDSVSEFELNRHTVAVGPDGTIYKLPLPLGPNGFVAMGRNAVAVAFGAKTAAEGAADTLAFLSDTFNPFGSGPVMQMMSPTLLDPFVQALTNQSFTGAKLAPDEEMFGRATKPPHELYWNNTGEIPRWVADALAGMTPKGDSGFSYIDIRPDIIEHFAEAALGGVGRSAYQIIDPIAKLASGETPEAREVFGIRDFIGSATPYAVDKRYGDIRERADAAKTRFKTLMEEGERERALDWRKANAALFAVEARIHTTERLLDRIPNTTEYEARRRTLKANLVRAYNALQ